MRSRGAAAVVLAALVAALVFAWEPLASGDRRGRLFSDWDQHLLYHDAARRSVADFGELPLWNPWLCFGHPTLANPQSRVVSPFFALHLALGTERALKVEIALHAFIAILGTALLARRAGATWSGAAAGGIVFGCCGAFALHLNEGHTWYLAFAWLPWAALLFDLGRERTSATVGAAGIVALIMLGGGTYPAPHAVMLLALLAAFEAGARRDLRPFARLLGVLALAAGLAAVKLLPMAELMSVSPRLTPPGGGVPFSALSDVMFDARRTIDSRAHESWPVPFMGWHEYGHPLTPLVVPLAALGLLSGGRWRWPLRAGLGLFLLLALGQFAPFDLWAALHRLPLFASLRNPSRFLIVVVLLAAVATALGLSALERRLELRGRRLALVVGVALAVLVGGLQVRAGRTGFTGAFPNPAPRPAAGEFRLSFGNALTMFAPSLANVASTVNCYEVAALQPRDATEAAGRPARATRLESWQRLVAGPPVREALPVAFETAQGRVAGAARVVRHTSSRFEVAVEAPAPGLLILGQTDDGHWVVEGGHPESAAGLIAARVNAGRSVVRFRHAPRAFGLGALASLLATALALALVARERRVVGSSAPAFDRPAGHP